MMAETPYLDIHTHHAAVSPGVVSVYNARFGEPVSGNRPVSLGIHPWYLTETEYVHQLALLEQALQSGVVTALGECGLDRLSGPPLPFQIRVLHQQLDLAKAYRVPVILHCVRAFPELISLVKQRKNTVPLIVHGYNANEQTARQLLAHSFYLSLGAALLRPGSNAEKCLAFLPSDRFFLETDDKPVSIEDIYAAASRQLQQPLPELKEQLMKNFQRVSLGG